MATIDRQALELVAEDLEKGAELTYSHIGSIFGTPFWELLVMGFLDAQDAARAIQGAIHRLRSVDDEDAFTYEDDDDDFGTEQ